VRWKEPTRAATDAFVARVARAGVTVTLRDTRGRDAEAACGQLLAARTLGDGSMLPAARGAAGRVDALLKVGARPDPKGDR
jgi:23S rRNA (adenine2503-C2)-methyltransferase